MINAFLRLEFSATVDFEETDIADFFNAWEEKIPNKTQTISYWTEKK